MEARAASLPPESAILEDTSGWVIFRTLIAMLGDRRAVSSFALQSGRYAFT